MKIIVLHNPRAGKADDTAFQSKLAAFYEGHELEFYDLTQIQDYLPFFNSLDDNAQVVLTGGDGTLNRFVNAIDGLDIKQELFYYPAGNCNDFWRDLGKTVDDPPLNFKEFTAWLPTVYVKDKSYKFLNGVGYGIDGYCCEVGDKLTAQGKKPDYTAIVVKGVFFHFKPADAEITCDGVTKTFKKVWIAPTMASKMYGGGMIPAPNQDRFSPDKTVTLCVFHGTGKLGTLLIFPKIFKGELYKHPKAFESFVGKEITVKFSRPCALQIDGETVLDVTEYTVKA